TPPCREAIPNPWLICHTIVGRAGDFRFSEGTRGRVMSVARIRRGRGIVRPTGWDPGPRDRRFGLGRVLGAWLILGPIAGIARAEEPGPLHPDPARLRAVVEILASPEFGGRSGPGAEKAAAYLVDQFGRLGLEGVFQGGFTQTIPGNQPGTRIGR